MTSLLLAMMTGSPAYGADSTFQALKRSRQERVAKAFELDAPGRAHGVGHVRCGIDEVQRAASEATVPLGSEFLGFAEDSGPTRVGYVDLEQTTLSRGPLVRILLESDDAGTQISVLSKIGSLNEHPFAISTSILENLVSICEGRPPVLPDGTGHFKTSAMPTLRLGVGSVARGQQRKPVDGVSVRRHPAPSGALLDVTVDLAVPNKMAPYSQQPVAAHIRHVTAAGEVSFEVKGDGLSAADIRWIDEARLVLQFGQELVRFRESGEILWRMPAHDMAAQRGIALVQRPSKNERHWELHSVSLESGDTNWKMKVEPGHALWVGDVPLLVVGGLGSLLNPTDGSTRAELSLPGSVEVVGDRLVHLGSKEVSVFSAEGSRDWSAPVNGPALVGGDSTSMHVVTQKRWRRWNAEREAAPIVLDSQPRSGPAVSAELAVMTTEQSVFLVRGEEVQRVARPLPAVGPVDRVSILPQGALVQDDANVFLVAVDGTIAWSLQGLQHVEWSSQALQGRLSEVLRATQAQWWLDELPPSKQKNLVEANAALARSQQAIFDQSMAQMDVAMEDLSLEAQVAFKASQRAMARTMAGIQLAGTAAALGGDLHNKAVESQQDAGRIRSIFRLEDLEAQWQRSVQGEYWVRTLRTQGRTGILAVRLSDGAWQELWVGPDVPVGQDFLPGPAPAEVQADGVWTVAVTADEAAWRTTDAAKFMPSVQPDRVVVPWAEWQPAVAYPAR